MREIVKILMRRDGISENEAWDIVYATQEEITGSIEEGASYNDIVDIIACNLGLEPDYMDVFLM